MQHVYLKGFCTLALTVYSPGQGEPDQIAPVKFSLTMVKYYLENHFHNNVAEQIKSILLHFKTSRLDEKVESKLRKFYWFYRNCVLSQVYFQNSILLKMCRYETLFSLFCTSYLDLDSILALEMSSSIIRDAVINTKVYRFST